MAQGDTAVSPTQLNIVEYGSGGSTFVPLGAPVAPRYNAIAYNEADDLIYAINIENHLVQIDNTGAATDLGLLGDLAASGIVPNAGAIDQATGTYWVLSSGDARVFGIDLGTLAVTTVPLLQATGAADIAVIGNSLYGQRVATDTLVRIVPGAALNFRLAFVPVPGLSPAVGAGAAWTYGNGNLGMSDNVTGDIYQLELTDPDGPGAAANIIAIADGPAAANNDGTACTGIPADLSIEKTGPALYSPNGPISWTITVTNNGTGTSSGFVVEDAVPAGVTGVSSPTVGCAVVGNDVTCTGGELLAGDSTDIVINGTAPAAGDLSNTATVTGNEDDAVSENNSATFLSEPGNSAPIVTITTPPDGAVYFVGQQVPADYECTDVDGTIATCDGPVADGANIDTATPGAKTFTVNATDNLGAPGSASNDYTVVQTLGACKGLGIKLLNGNLGVANNPESPCATQSSAVINANLGFGPTLPLLLQSLTPKISAQAILGLSSTGPGAAAGSAYVANASITVPALGISLQVAGVHTAATSFLTSCDAPAVLGSTSRVARITLNGVTIPGEAAELTIPLVVGTLHLNQKLVSGNSIVRRAVFLDLPGTAFDVVIAESKAGVVCAPVPPPAP